MRTTSAPSLPLLMRRQPSKPNRHAWGSRSPANTSCMKFFVRILRVTTRVTSQSVPDRWLLICGRTSSSRPGGATLAAHGCESSRPCWPNLGIPSTAASDSTRPTRSPSSLPLPSKNSPRAMRVDVKNQRATVSLNGRRVEYRVRDIATTDRLRIRVGMHGVDVLRPAARSNVDPEAFLLSHGSWVVEQMERVERLQGARRVAHLPFGSMLLRGTP